MAQPTDAIYQLLRELFVARFEAMTGALAELRFDRKPRVLADKDFLRADRSRPDDRAAVAAERLAEICDGVPLLVADGRSVELGPRSISALYRDQLVVPAAQRPRDATETEQEDRARVDEFDQLRRDAMQRLDSIREASLIGAGWFHPVQATPGTWWDRTAVRGWTAHTIDLGRGRARSAPGQGTISFEYCVVQLTRAWLSDALLASPSWCVPGERRGRFSANDGAGLPALPVGFVAIRRLSIAAGWPASDASAPSAVLQVGPFAVDLRLDGDVVGRDGVQIIGWLLHHLASLPPNDGRFSPGGPPAGPATTLRSYCPLPPPSRGDQEIPLVARVDAAGYRALASREQSTVVFVSAVWAGPSRQMERVVELLARELRDEIAFTELAFEAIEGTSVVRQLGLLAVPSFILLDRGREVARLVGMVPEALIASVHALRSSERDPSARPRVAPLWGVPRLERSTFEAALRRRDTLVFFADPANRACRALESMVQAVSALYAPWFQTYEIDCSADPELLGRLGDPRPGSFVLYRLGAEVARVTWPSSRPELMKRLGIA